LTQFFQYIVVGLANGGVYATLALALVLIHRATGIVNFAQGEMGMFCTYICWALITHHGIPYWGAFFITLLIAFVGGAATYKAIIQPLSRTGELTVVMATIALLIILNGLVGWIWAPDVKFLDNPFPLKAFSATELAKMPRYYIMDLDKTMPENVAPDMPTPEEIAANTWLTDEELRVYSSEFGRTSFQGGLNSYRLQTDPSFSAELRLYSGATIDVPSMFISGKSDWGAFQRAGRLEAMRDKMCTDLRGIHLLDGAGHWVQQEQPEVVVKLLTEFLQGQNRVG